jgi:RimJ/RimL family protein N-acetyltransferase
MAETPMRCGRWSTTSRETIALRGPAWFGRGFSTEATRLIVAHGLDTIGLASISLEVLVRNQRARAVYDKVGFVVEREFDDDGESWVQMSVGDRGEGTLRDGAASPSPSPPTVIDALRRLHGPHRDAEPLVP